MGGCAEPPQLGLFDSCLLGVLVLLGCCVLGLVFYVWGGGFWVGVWAWLPLGTHPSIEAALAL